MVRAIVGTLLWVGRGKIDALTFEKIVAASDRAMAGPSAPANGLCLIAVDYSVAGGEAAGRSDSAKRWTTTYGDTRATRELDEADE
jgi:tRNA U38,U39,U40 pseudouridine synthase TruA